MFKQAFKFIAVTIFESGLSLWDLTGIFFFIALGSVSIFWYLGIIPWIAAGVMADRWSKRL